LVPTTSDTWQKENDINNVGGSQEDTFAGFDPQGHGVKVLEMTLPLIRHYHEQGPGSGANDPLIQALDTILEAEMPGYKDHPENADQGLLQKILDLTGDNTKGSDEDPTALPDVDDDNIVEEKDEEREPKDDAGDHGENDDRDDNDIGKESSVKLSKCAACNSLSNFPLGMCFNCGFDVDNNRPHYVRTAGGPANAEQFKAVADLLRSQGREDEIPALIDNPDAFTQELLEVQHQQQISPPDDGGLTQEAPMPEEQGDQPGAGMPMPPPPTGQQPMASVHTALNAVQCPKCKSHTTTILDTETGYSQCHTCGHKFDTDLEPSDGHSTHHDVTAAADDLNPTNVDAADQEHQVFPSGDATSNMTWADSEGSPLQVGKTYLVYSPKYKIPDRQLITAVKPHSYTYEQSGEYGISHANEITKQEADMDGLQFVPADDPGNEELGTHNLEQNDDFAGGEGVGPNEQTDISDSSEYQHAASFDPKFNPSGNWLMQEGDMSHTAGKNYTSWEQRELIMEPGVARNLNKLDIAQTHYDPEWNRDGDDEFLW
jgi:ribosomal protein S27E